MSRAILFPLVLLASSSLLFVAPPVAKAGMVNRWSFNNTAANAPAGTTLTDTISNAPAVVRGVGATLNGTALVLPGSGNGAVAPASISAYLDLPNGIVSSKNNLTLEIWLTPISDKSWQRVFDFGRPVSNGDGNGEYTGTGATAPGGDTSFDNLNLAVETGTAINTQRMGARIAGAATELGVNTTLATTLGTKYQYVLTYTDNAGSYGSGGGQAAWYRNGVLAATLDLNFHLRDMHDVNNWLGRSMFSNDSCSNVAYDEVRLYDVALTAAQIASSNTAGPNATFTAPVANADSATTHLNQKVRIPVLANDTNSPNAGGITVIQAPQYGTATPDGSGSILYVPTTTSAPASDSFTYRVTGAGGPSNGATVTVNFSSAFRLTNAGSTNVPLAPPATAVQVASAFGTLSFSQPVGMVSPPGDPKRLFVLEKTGLLRVISDVTAAAATATTFLDINAVQSAKGETLSTNSEQGLLGLAFHPNYATNGYFYLYYSALKSGVVYERISRFKVSTGSPNVADATSEYGLISQLDDAGNHNAGGMAFGADGYLYITIGDEGGGNDQYGNSQKIDKDFFSCFLRIDVDKKAGNLAPNASPNPAYYPSNPPADAVVRDAGVARYSVPADNPFVGATTFNGAAVNPSYVRTEFYAVGMRNPWRWSFDTASATAGNPNGDLWCADVGQDAYEEVDIITKGGNFGWAYREALHAGPKGTAPTGVTFIDPIYEYTHGSGTFQGNSITGGFVYRGSRFASLTGKYVFADYVSGNIWSLARNGAAAPTVVRIAGSAGVVAFAPDPSNGDVLMANINQGIIQRLTVGTADTTYPATLSATNLFADLGDLSPNPGLVPYVPNLSFWSDYAIKSRFVTIPDATSKMVYAKEGAWTYPTGTVWVKHFDLDLTRGDDTTKKRIETRVLVKTADNVYGVSYRWNDAGTDATLVDDAGQDFNLTINDGTATPYTQAYHVPSRAECITCHNAQAGGALSFNTRQLNHESVVPGFAGNFLSRLSQGGYLSNTPDAVNTLPRHVAASETSYPLEARVRSYLAVNCAYCHQPGGTAPTNWNALAQVTLDQTGLINGAVIDNKGNAANKLIVPGDTLHSVVYNRVGASNGFTRMPPLASTEIDQPDLALLAAWINDTTLINRQTYDQWRLAKFGSATSPAGAPTADPDGDGHTNQEEYLAGTNPLVSGSFFAPQFARNGATVTLSANVPANVSFQVEASADLASWSLWDVSGNNGIPQPGGTVTLTGTATIPKQFFRVRLTGN